jgi:hypothetical protein
MSNANWYLLSHVGNSQKEKPLREARNGYTQNVAPSVPTPPPINSALPETKYRKRFLIVPEKTLARKIKCALMRIVE